jgi:hypothetical protein
MPERPSVYHDGRRYERHSGGWHDDKHLRLSKQESAALDVVARKDAGLWSECQRQDLDDRPAAFRQRGSGRRRPSTSFPAAKLEWHFKDGTLELRGDITASWGRRAKAWAYAGQARVIAPGDQIVRVTMFVFARTAYGEMDIPPMLADTAFDVDGVRFAVQGQLCSASVNLLDCGRRFSPDLRWEETDTGKPTLHRQYDGLRREAPAAEHREEVVLEGQFEIQLLLVVEPPAKKPAPTYYEWARHFFPGGLPSLGRRA